MIIVTSLSKKEHLKNFWQHKKKLIILLFTITVFGAFLRLYGFPELIFFEIDQARDYKLLHDVVSEGFGEMPIVGPKAGGTFFRLGPVYYFPTVFLAYFFGPSPFILIVPEIILSILTIPLLFFFLREFFIDTISLFCTAIFATNIFLVEYAHFSWNPNYVPFFFLLFLYSLLRYARTQNHGMLWSVIIAVSVGVLMQLHTITFVMTPLVLVIYFIFLQKKLPWQHVLMCCGIIFLFFMPLIFNDLLTGGENTKEFTKAVVERQDKSNNASLPKTFFVNAYNHVKYYTIILTSHHLIADLARLQSSNDLHDLLQKNIHGFKAQINMIIIIITIVALAAIWMIMAWKSYVARKSGIKNNQKMNFIALMLIVQIICAAFFVPLAMKADSRHFLPLVFVPYIFLGFICQMIVKYVGGYGKNIVYGFCIILLCMNIIGTVNWLQMVDGYDSSHIKGREIILESYFVVTMRQWNNIVQRISTLAEHHDGSVYIDAPAYHVRSLIYLLQFQEKKNVSLIDPNKVDANGMYFVLREMADVNEGGLLSENMQNEFTVIGLYDFGTVALVQVAPKNMNEISTNVGLTTNQSDQSRRCYETQYEIESRDKCRVRDIKNIITQWLQ